MMPILRGAAAEDWLKQSRSGSHLRKGRPESAVRELLHEVRSGGDKAIAKIAARFNDPNPRRISADSAEVEEARIALSSDTKATIEFAASRITAFARAIMESLHPVKLDYKEYSVGLKFAPVERAACYVPAGRYPLPSTALMTAITARTAGVREIAIFTPKFLPEILFAGALAGASEFFEIGGAQAIAAAAFGTETIKSVNVIAGPGNAYIAEAKRQVNGIVGIDMLAGPSEIAVIADASGNPEWIALDLLSQAEHDADARAYLITADARVAEQVAAALPQMAGRLNLSSIVQESLSKSAMLVFNSMDECIAAANEIAPEHLLLHVTAAEKLAPSMKNYGALFMGYNATVPYGDYCAGPNHTLPTDRAAKFSGGLTPLTFLRAQSWLQVDSPAAELAEMTSSFADIEGLKAHSAASRARLNQN
jgi:histidinol dehydrogenase